MSERKKHIEIGWRMYRAMFIPANASSVIVNELRQAYYTGAATLFEFMLRASSESREPTDEDLRTVGDLHAEIVDFSHSLDERVFGKTAH